MTKEQDNYLRDAEEFISSLQTQTGVSDRFIEEARASITLVFKEVAAEFRASCLDAIRQSATTQAETEASIERALVAAERLKNTQIVLMNNLTRLRVESSKVRDTAVASAYSTLATAFPSSSVSYKN